MFRALDRRGTPMTPHLDVRHVTTSVHGRYVLRPPATPTGRLLVGFHGYGETAEAQFDRLARLPGADGWTVVSVQALHPFYRGRSQEVVANWMTRVDRDLAIADNVAYIDRVIDDVSALRAVGPIVYAGFSQGVAMAYRAALRGGRRCAGIIAIGGDLPPELEAVDAAAWHHLTVLVARGAGDDWFTQDKMDADLACLAPRVASVDAVVVDAGHEWTPAFDEPIGRFLAAAARQDLGQP